jgi:hypothetical protein
VSRLLKTPKKILKQKSEKNVIYVVTRTSIQIFAQNVKIIFVKRILKQFVIIAHSTHNLLGSSYTNII